MKEIIRYDIYIKNKLWRSVYESPIAADIIAKITQPYNEFEYYIKTIKYY